MINNSAYISIIILKTLKQEQFFNLGKKVTTLSKLKVGSSILEYTLYNISYITICVTVYSEIKLFD